MKTNPQILKKIAALKTSLKKRQIYENFGQKEVRKLEEFIGPVSDYTYYDRLENIKIISDFDNWCLNYTGKEYYLHPGIGGPEK